MRLALCTRILIGLSAVSGLAQTVAAQNPAARPAPAAAFPSRVLRQTTFNIPFTVETARQPLEVQLYLSRDQGQTWKLYARQNPSAKFFPFHATEDGEYWFASQTIDGSQSAQEMAGRQPELHVVIDTRQPEIEFQANVGPSREIQIAWRCTDPAIDPNSLKIEYQAGREQPWIPVTPPAASASSSVVNSTVSGRWAFRPQTAWAELQVRAEISDLARNRAVVSRRLSLSGVATNGNPQPQWRPVARRSPPDPNVPVVLPPTTNEPTRLAANPNPPPSGISPSGIPPSGIPVDPYVNASITMPPSAAAGAPPSSATVSDRAPTTEWKSTQSTPPRHGLNASESGVSPTAPNAAAPVGPLDELASEGYRPQTGQVHPLVSQQIVAPQQNGSDEFDATVPSTLRNDSNRVDVGQIRMTSAMRFELDYEFDAAAANGVRSVELWGTRDRGQTWSQWQVDEDRRSPVDVRVDAEGTYGFRIVIVGNNGLAGDPPRNGDDADLWVGIDTTAPQVEIHTATYGQGEHAGQLEIRWRADDATFGDGPISIFFSDRAAGPWTTMAAGIPNSGQYFWPIDPRVPEQLYLRIEARDQAGNLGEYRLADPINLAGFTPQGRIRGIRPLPPAQPPSTNPPVSDASSASRATRNPYAYR